MALYVGTCGYSHKEWKGTFYPEDVGQKYMLEFYSGRFPAVEINHTFRQLPTAISLDAWRVQSQGSSNVRQPACQFSRSTAASNNDFVTLEEL